jgi:hypothetical protein
MADTVRRPALMRRLAELQTQRHPAVVKLDKLVMDELITVDVGMTTARDVVLYAELTTAGEIACAGARIKGVSV